VLSSHDDRSRPVSDRTEHDDTDHRPLRLRVVRIPPWLTRREVVIDVGRSVSAAEEHWTDEIVSVEQGAIDVVGRCGRVVHFDAGAVLCFDGVAYVDVRCASAVPAVLVAIRRRPPDG
jgi:hypothetical protein